MPCPENGNGPHDYGPVDADEDDDTVIWVLCRYCADLRTTRLRRETPIPGVFGGDDEPRV